MKTLNKNQKIAVAVGLAFLAYLLFGDAIINIFRTPMNTTNPEGEQVNLDEVLAKEGFLTQELAVGQGATAEAGDSVTVHYVGVLQDGQVFDSSLERGTPFNFTLGVGQVIRGWDEGVQGMKVGGKRLIVISPEYAYGEQAVGSIPPNSTLIFEVELLETEKPSAQ